MAWGSTHQTKIKKLHCFQKHDFRTMCGKDRRSHSKPRIQSLKILNYRLSVHEIFSEWFLGSQITSILQLLQEIALSHQKLCYLNLSIRCFVRTIPFE